MFWIVTFWGAEREYHEGFFAKTAKEAKEIAIMLSCNGDYSLKVVNIF